MSTCTVDNCDSKVLAKGMCSKHYTRVRSHDNVSTVNTAELPLEHKVYGRLTVKGFSHKKNNKTFYYCECSCGTKAVVRKDTLTSGGSKSCGCLQKEVARGSMTDDERFMSKVDKSDKCWEWLGYTCGTGYGSFSTTSLKGERRMHRAHRYSYSMHNGHFDESLRVCHKCDNPKCVNPAHLFLGTDQDNMNDKVAKGRQAVGENTGSSKLTEADVLAIRRLGGSKELTRNELSMRYNVSVTNIGNILNRKVWRHI